MRKLLRKQRPSASLVISMIALFVALGGAGYAATGGNFILGQANTATTPSSLSAPIDGNALRVINTATGPDATALGLRVASGHAPFTVNSTKKVKDLNGDLLDNLDSTAFIRKGVAQSSNASTAGGVVDVRNTGSSNGVQGKATSLAASGVYGENTSTGGFGVAGRAGNLGHAVYGDNTGSGYAGYFEDKVHIGGELDCSGCVGPSDIEAPGFIQGGGKAGGQALAEGAGNHIFLGPPLLGFLRFSYACPSNLANNGSFNIYNNSGSVANVFYESGDANPTYASMANGDQLSLPASATGDSFHIQAQGALGILTVEAATVHRASDCHAQVQGLLTN